MFCGFWLVLKRPISVGAFKAFCIISWQIQFYLMYNVNFEKFYIYIFSYCFYVINLTTGMFRLHNWWTTNRAFYNALYRVSQKHGNSVTNWISSLYWISILIPNFKSHNSIMSARVYFMKRVKDCKDVFMMSPQGEQGWRTSLLCLYIAIFLFY